MRAGRGLNQYNLKTQKHGVKMIGNDLQIVPEDIHRMLRRLRVAVDEIVTLTLTDPRFLASAAKFSESRVEEE